MVSFTPPGRFTSAKTEPSSFISTILGQCIFLGTLFINTLNLYSSLKVKGQVSRPYNTADEIMFYYIHFILYVFRQQERGEDILK
jgi:hypothetical protein